MISPELRKGARIFTIGAACGFLAGALALALVVWRFGNVIGTHEALARGAKPPSPIERWDGGPIDDDAPVLEAAPVATSGTAHDAPSAPPVLSAPPAAELADRDLELPVEGITRDQLVRSFEDARGSRRHEAIDILAPLGTPVKAVEGGRIARLFVSRAGGITIYQFDPTERFCYYYAHLDRYADGLRENDVVRKGQVIGYVGVTGNAPKNTPHLHFAIFRLTAEKRWWEGTPLDPYDVLR
ncbi:MAG TPA: M23 family metallopeptidase [Vicinamibacterales bacterium]|nr:M23 family metallopeptidase [Vicinamibacterales bacterium]